MIAETLKLLSEGFHWLWTSLPGSSLFTALIGAFFGAVGARLNSEHSERRRRLLQRLESTNAAITLLNAITNDFYGFKSNQALRLVKEYEEAEKSYREQKAAQPHPPIKINLDLPFTSIFEIKTPIDTIQKLLFEQIYPTGRVLRLTTTLVNCLHALSIPVKMREEIISEFKAGKHDGAKKFALIFGLPHDGVQSRAFPECTYEILQKTDDCIVFSQLIADDLRKHSDQLAKEYGNGAPTYEPLNFRIAEEKGLKPDMNNYKDWLPSGNDSEKARRK